MKSPCKPSWIAASASGRSLLIQAVMSAIPNRQADDITALLEQDRQARSCRGPDFTMNLLHTLIAFFVALGSLVVVHELGHYLVARWCGVKVLRFSVGMGRVIWSRRFGRDQTEWALSVRWAAT
jgi:hypothetical protein